MSIDRIQRGSDDAPWHTLIEADNYHALQLLEYIYAGQVDCIYIDPPYNKGARDWKYNNDYVDENDAWRHSKWCAFMARRLKRAKRLLKPDSGVIIVTVDEHEIHHLGMLMESIFPEAYRQLITIVITSKGVAKQGLARVEEYAFFAYLGKSSASSTDDDYLTCGSGRPKKTPWASLLRRGTNAAPIDRPGLVYPIVLDPDRHSIIGAGESLAEKMNRREISKSDLKEWRPETRTKNEAWPIRSDGSLGTWQVNPAKLLDLKEKGFVKLGRFDEHRVSWAINYLKRGPLKEIEHGNLIIKGYEWEGGPVILEYLDESPSPRRAKTVWYRTSHDAGTYGTDLLRKILGNRSFEFPKSLYAVRDTLAAITSENKTALIVDFFAGSGTTLHAVDLLNSKDGGKRRCILVTNNEVSADDVGDLQARRVQQGSEEWEASGICQSITWPRCKYAISGKRDDGSELIGEYLTGKATEKEKNRIFHEISFTSVENLKTVAKKKELVSLIENLPQSEVKKESAFIISEDYPASILFDDSQSDEWLEALEGQEHITDFYIVTGKKAVLDDIKRRVIDLLGPIVLTEEEKRPMREGFPSNLEYFRMKFLDKDRVALGRQFWDILPLLWLRAGAVGPRPEFPNDAPIPAMLLPDHSQFAILLDENRFADFLEKLEGRNITHVYLVTDSEEGFQEMAAQLWVPNITQLYRDYLENFVINRGETVE